jgi:hypothetical protein
MKIESQPDTTMRTIRIAFLIGLAAATISSAWAAEKGAVKKDMAQLQGEWLMVSGSADGYPCPTECSGGPNASAREMNLP